MDLQQWKRSGKYFQYNGYDIFFQHQGTGPVILCIHGFPTSSWDWNKLWGGLLQNYQLVAPDMIGFGYSPKPQNYSYSILDQADLHESLLNFLEIEDVHILAHDYGDTVAQEILARHDQQQTKFRIHSLCLLNGGLFPEVHRARLIQKLLLTPVGKWIAASIDEKKFMRSFRSIFSVAPTQQELNEFWSLVSLNNGTKIAHKLMQYITERKKYRARWVGSLQKTDVPLRFINGLEDPISGIHMVQRYRELIDKYDVIELAGIGHYPQTEAPHLVLDAYLKFIS